MKLHEMLKLCLLAPVRLVIDQGQSGIYLVERSEEEPAFRVYCGGCTPAQRAKQQARQLMPA